MEKQSNFRISTPKQYEDTMIHIFELQEQEEELTDKQKLEIEIMLKEAMRYEEEEL